MARWSIIASQLHGRTDNDVKNHWNTKLKKKLLATKSNNNGSNGNNPNDNPTLIGSTLSHPSSTTNSENYMNLGFSTLITQDFQASPTMLANVNYGLTVTAQNFVHDPIHFTCPILTNLTQASANAVKNHSVSTSQEASSISGSSSIGLDEKCVPWTSNGGGDGFLMDFGLGFPNEFVSGFWSLEKSSEGGAPTLVSSLDDSGLYADIKPQGLLQSVINQ